MPTAGRPKITVRLDEEELRKFQAIAYNLGIPAAELARLLIVARVSVDDDESYVPYQGDRGDLVACLEWLKDQLRCTKPGREMAWLDFDNAIDLAKIMDEVNESMRNSLRPERTDT